MRFRLSDKSASGVLRSFLMKPWSSTASPFQIVNTILAIRSTRRTRTSHKPCSSFRTNGIPMGHPNCSSRIALPIVFTSGRGSALSHSRTGSAPELVGKKRTVSLGRSTTAYLFRYRESKFCGEKKAPQDALHVRSSTLLQQRIKLSERGKYRRITEGQRERPSRRCQ